ncbi:MAG TPA: MBL fold metallo-hydrolase [Verrucomicrobiae bacterium]|nr:MBL fold metallo-hydrolase [Verrucomicrobiae bacterium]
MRCLCLLTLLVFGWSLRAGPVSLEYLGTAGWRVTSGKLVILIDPYLSRVKYPSPNDNVDPNDPRPLIDGRSIVESDKAVVDAHIDRADFIFLTHSHPDHSLDMPYIARKTGAKVIGTESTGNLARAEGVPERQIQVVKGGEQLTFDGFSVRVIPSLHGIFRKPAPGAPPPQIPLIPRDLQAPVRFGQHVEGGTLAYLLEIGGHRMIFFGSMNYIEKEVNGLRPDVAMIGAMPERNNIEDYTPRLMRALGNPPLVIPTHWDRFNVPYSVSQQPAVDRLQSFIEEIKAVSPKTRVIVPEYFKPIPLE